MVHIIWDSEEEQDEFDSLVALGRRAYEDFRVDGFSHAQAFEMAKREHGLKSAALLDIQRRIKGRI